MRYSNAGYAAMMALIAAVALILMTTLGFAATFPKQGAYCWVQPTTYQNGNAIGAGEIKGNVIYVTRQGQPEQRLDVGLPTPGYGNCGPGAVGVLRDVSTSVSGNYVVQVTAYVDDPQNPGQKLEGTRSDVYGFTVDTACTVAPCAGSPPNKPGSVFIK